MIAALTPDGARRGPDGVSLLRRCYGTVPSPTLRRLLELGSEYVQPLDHRRGREKDRRLFHQRLGDRPIEVRLATRLVPKRVEDRERAFAETQGEPERGRR